MDIIEKLKEWLSGYTITTWLQANEVLDIIKKLENKVEKTTENRILEKLKEWLNNKTSTTWMQKSAVLDKIEELEKGE